MSRDFYELCYEQYKHEMSESDRIYQRAGIMLAVLPLIGVVMAKLGRQDIVDLFFTRVDTFLFYLSFVVAACTMVASVVFLFISILPRKYKTLANMDVWQDWREKYQKYLDAIREDDTQTEEASNLLDMAMFENVSPKLAEAQPINAELNEKRRKAFRWSILMTAISLAAVGVLSIFSIILALQGV